MLPPKHASMQVHWIGGICRSSRHPLLHIYFTTKFTTETRVPFGVNILTKPCTFVDGDGAQPKHALHGGTLACIRQKCGSHYLSNCVELFKGEFSPCSLKDLGHFLQLAGRVFLGHRPAVREVELWDELRRGGGLGRGGGADRLLHLRGMQRRHGPVWLLALGAGVGRTPSSSLRRLLLPPRVRCKVARVCLLRAVLDRHR